jgi:hypothetical protein
MTLMPWGFVLMQAPSEVNATPVFGAGYLNNEKPYAIDDGIRLF